MKAGWEVKPLSEVCETVSTGPFGSLLGKKDYVGTGVPLVNPVDIVDGVIHPASVKRVSTETAQRLSGYRMQTGDIVVARRGELGRCAQVSDRNDGWLCGTGSFFIRPRNSIFADYLEQYIRSPTSQAIFEAASTGATMPNISNKTLSNLPIPLPPFEEQQRIVAVLDEAFEGLARARAHAEANLQNARELFENSLSAFIDRHKESWSSTTLGEAYDVRDGTHDSPKYHTTGRALITSKNLGRDGLHFEKVKFISEEDFESIRKRSGVHKGDVLFAMIGTIGNPIVADVEPDFAIKNVALFKMKEGRSGQFLRYILRSKHVADKMKAEAKGTTQQFVGLGYLRAFPIILPKQPKEMALVDDLDRMETQCRSAEDLYEKKLQDLDDLRQSLLQKAFAGELT